MHLGLKLLYVVFSLIIFALIKIRGKGKVTVKAVKTHKGKGRRRYHRYDTRVRRKLIK